MHELSSRSCPSVLDLAASYWFLPKITRPNEVNSFGGLQACISKRGLLVAQNYKYTYLQKQILTAAAFEFLKSTGGLKKEFKWNNWRTIWMGNNGWDIPDVSDTPPIPIRGRKRPPLPIILWSLIFTLVPVSSLSDLCLVPRSLRSSREHDRLLSCAQFGKKTLSTSSLA